MVTKTFFLCSFSTDLILTVKKKGIFKQFFIFVFEHPTQTKFFGLTEASFEASSSDFYHPKF